MPITQEQIEKIVSLARSYGATRLILFGSIIENRQRQEMLILLVTELLDGSFMSWQQG